MTLNYMTGAEAVIKALVDNEVEVITSKAIGKKCPVCWKIRKDECERHGVLN